MNLNAVSKSYSLLTPEERFRLILSASGRNDEVERKRLVTSGERIELSIRAHAPFAHAFDELSLLVFLDVLEDGQGYLNLFDHAFEPRKSASKRKIDEASDGEQEPAGAERDIELALVAGFLLRTKVEGWTLFCQGLDVLPFLLWQELPGFKRLEGILKLAEQAAFAPEGYVRWMNRNRPAGSPKLKHVPFSARGIAKSLEVAFREHIEWWNG